MNNFAKIRTSKISNIGFVQLQACLREAVPPIGKKMLPISRKFLVLPRQSQKLPCTDEAPFQTYVTTLSGLLEFEIRLRQNDELLKKLFKIAIEGVFRNGMHDKPIRSGFKSTRKRQVTKRVLQQREQGTLLALI